METHPAAGVFPLLEGSDFEALREDIRKRGQLEPCITWVDETDTEWLLDGRNRSRACADLGIEPSVRRVECPPSDVVALVVSLNLRRRHLTPTQLAAVTVALARMLAPGQGARTDLDEETSCQSAGGDGVQQACALTGAAERTVYRAKSVADSDDPRAPEMFARMLAGTMSTNAAVTQLRPEKSSPPTALDTKILRVIAGIEDTFILHEIINCIRERIAELEAT